MHEFSPVGVIAIAKANRMPAKVTKRHRDLVPMFTDFMLTRSRAQFDAVAMFGNCIQGQHAEKLANSPRDSKYSS